MKILMITPAFPPYEGSHTQRMISIANCLVKNGIELSVLTLEVMKGHPSYSEDSTLKADSRVRIYRTQMGKLHRKIYSLKRNDSNDKKKDSRLTKNIIRKKGGRIIEQLKRRVLIPDTMIDWYFPAVKYVKKNRIIEKIKPDLILSCSMPNTCHVIGYSISKKYKIPQIMDYGDPWAFIANYSHNKLRFIFEKKLEAKIIKGSKLVSFSTNGCELLYQDKYQTDSKKTLTVMTGYDSELLDVARDYVPARHDNIIMTYGGAIQENVRNPIPFFRAVDDYVDDTIRFNIRTDKIDYVRNLVEEKTTNNRISVFGYVPFRQYYLEMLEADVLVFFGNSTTDQLPGKIFNYLPTQKLILYILNVKDKDADQAVGIMEDYGNAVVVNNTYEEICLGLKTVKRRLEENASVDMNKVEKYSTENQMKNLVNRIALIQNN